jgi:hypothetical protein
MKANIFIVMISFAGLFLSQTLFAEEKKATCGSGMTEQIVPESFLGCDFSDACKKHDECYGICDVGGAQAGSDYCKLPELDPQRVASKTQCDLELRNTIISNNHGDGLCSKFALVYELAVKKFGQGPFNGKEMQDLIQKVVESSSSPEEAETKFTILYSLNEEKKINLKKMTLTDGTLIIPIKRGVNISEFQQGKKLVIPAGGVFEKLKEIKVQELK